MSCETVPLTNAEIEWVRKQICNERRVQYADAMFYALRAVLKAWESRPRNETETFKATTDPLRDGQIWRMIRCVLADADV